MQFIGAGLLVLSGAILIGLAFHDTVLLGWQDISGAIPKNPPSPKGPGKQ